MKITFVSPAVSQGGGSRVIAIYAQKLLAMGHDVTVVSRLPRSPTMREQLSHLLRKQSVIRVDPARTIFFDGLGDRHIQVEREGPLLPEDLPDADVVIATWWRTAFEVATMPPEKGVKVYFIQGYEVFEHLPWDISAGSYFLPLKKITICQWLVDIMADVYQDKDVAKIANSVDTDLFNAPVRVRNEKPTVGLIYSKTRFKGADVTLRAIDIARRRFPDIRVISFGGENPSYPLALPAGSNFFKAPKQHDISKIYASCDIWLSGSRTEGFGLPILEAMACRTPVIATDTGAARDLISDGVNGYVIDVEDADAMAQRIGDILSLSPPDWQKMSEAAHARTQSYSWDDAARAFAAELEKLVSTERKSLRPVCGAINEAPSAEGDA